MLASLRLRLVLLPAAGAHRPGIPGADGRIGAARLAADRGSTVARAAAVAPATALANNDPSGIPPSPPDDTSDDPSLSQGNPNPCTNVANSWLASAYRLHTLKASTRNSLNSKQCVVERHTRATWSPNAKGAKQANPYGVPSWVPHSAAFCSRVETTNRTACIKCNGRGAWRLVVFK